MSRLSNKLSIEELKRLCDFKNGMWISKKGDNFINAFKDVFELKNKNDLPFLINDIKKEPTLESFRFIGKNDFIFTCEIHTSPMKIDSCGKVLREKVYATNFLNSEAEKVYKNHLGVAYILTTVIGDKEHIIKFGQTRTSFEKRLVSYNCGTVANWRTASTTNIRILQSFVANRLCARLYLYACGKPFKITWHNIESVEFATPMILAVEDIIVKEYVKQFKKKPLANIQANATKLKKEDNE